MNIAEFISENAKRFPTKKAITYPSSSGLYEYYDFKTYNERSHKYAQVLKSQGVVRGQRVLVFIKPSLNFSIIIFALFRLGAVPIMIDPGMGIKNLLTAIKNASPEVMIAEPLVYLIRLLKKDAFKSLKLTFTPNDFTFGKIKGLSRLVGKESNVTEICENLEAKDLAAILFTSGGTGEPKGVEYTHGILKAQTLKLKEMYTLTPMDVDLPGFPLFSLFTLAIGMTSCIPAMNPSRPAKVNPKKIVKNIQEQNVTFAAGSPAIWLKVADYCLENQIKLSSVRSLVMFGAPVEPELLSKLAQILPNGDSYTPYGATECLPITNISGQLILKNQQSKYATGAGTCVGKPAPGVKIKIISNENRNFLNVSDCHELPLGSVGEILVHSDTVTARYFNAQVATLESKITGPEGLWHRMGDVGYFDKDGYLWFCGRKSHVIETGTEKIYSVQIENIFNQIPEIKRTALVGLMYNEKVAPALVVELKSVFQKNLVLKKIETIKHNLPTKTPIKDVFFATSFPVDVRHNIKIDRLKLRDYYQGKV
ncbi:MAG: AMP-binding protein [Bacteriovoracaceae bacterium]|nr:AMP-binding protein [Bacteriovoracaceae bacterium]